MRFDRLCICYGCRIALSEQTRKESVDNLNQLLADTITIRDLRKKHHWQFPAVNHGDA
jgi:DNA-binding ferritin-like protein